jgi:hypothetical protein
VTNSKAVPPKAPFSLQSIEALVEAVTGGEGNAGVPQIGKYRTRSQLNAFLAQAGIRCSGGSRVPSVREALQSANSLPADRPQLFQLLEAVANPAEYLNEPELGHAVVQYLNDRLRFDGLELRHEGDAVRVRTLGTSGHAAEELAKKLEFLDFDSVSADFARASKQAEADPAGAVTSACSTVESVCKCLLDEMNEPYPGKQDVSHLVGAVAKKLRLDPARGDLPPDCAKDIRQVLGGLQTVAGGIGALRTHAGDAHGRGKRAVLLDARIARLSIHAASTISLFFIETWKLRTSEK